MNCRKRYGSILGLLITVAIGLSCYFIIPNIGGVFNGPSYNDIINNIQNDHVKQILWGVMNFTEPNFYAGVISGLMVILGGFVAWILSIKNSKYAGFDICYGNSTMWPWVFASQIISLFFVIFVFNYTSWFDGENITWIPTFIAIVGAPPSLMLLYGPSIRVLLLGSFLGGLICAPISYWLGNTLVPFLNIPGVVANVSAMAISGIMICFLFTKLGFIQKKEIRNHRTNSAKKEDVYSTSWFIRRVLAEFSEALFYGNEVASIFLLIGVLADSIMSNDLLVYGSGLIGSVLLSQFIGAGIGVYLYASKFDNNGWYATYVPVVSVGPACVLMFGGTITIAIISGVLGGLLGAPTAEYFGTKLPDGVHGTNANVLSMALCTVVISVVIRGLGF